MNNSQEAIQIVHCYEGIIKTQNEKAIGHIGKQGQLLTYFIYPGNFLNNIRQGRSTIYFKVSLSQVLEKHHLLEESTPQSSDSKNNFKAIKIACKENSTLFG